MGVLRSKLGTIPTFLLTLHNTTTQPDILVFLEFNKIVVYLPLSTRIHNRSNLLISTSFFQNLSFLNCNIALVNTTASCVH